MKYQRLGGFIHKNKFISHRSEAGKSKVKVLADLVSNENPLVVIDRVFSLCSLMAQGERALRRPLF